MFHFNQLVAHLLIVLVEEITETENYVDFIGSGFNRKPYFGYFHFNETLSRGEAARH